MIAVGRTRTQTLKNRIRVLSSDKLGIIALLIILLFIFGAIFAKQISPYPEQGAGQSNISNTLAAPSAEHLSGTDRQGRDILSRILFGLRTSLEAAFLVTALAVMIGVPLGAIAGFIGGVVDEVIMRITDVFLAFPALLLAIALVAALGPSLGNAILAIALSWWPWYTRIVRSVAVSMKNALFIDAARVIGVSRFKIIFRHIIPNTLTPVIVQASMDIGSVILAEASLSFLGFGRSGATGKRRKVLYFAAVVVFRFSRPRHFAPGHGVQHLGRFDSGYA
ncbi:ABC transporter permease [Ferviditalea candida]|uniref:ABC transporter permease n=1 Tax=Ferviditalea candida TaxID=3108399 RepID=A0ABU5ZGB0_9BACL|nr:ABC transporter permease [Paenibacillaceae bacterium T2]